MPALQSHCGASLLSRRSAKARQRHSTRPLRLVIRGPYCFVRNPMYIGAALALAGAALFYKSALLLAYAAAFLVVCHLFVLAYEEPTLRRTSARNMKPTADA